MVLRQPIRRPDRTTEPHGPSPDLPWTVGERMVEKMTVSDTTNELVPLRTDFDRVWHGYDRDQVQFYVNAVEADMRLLATDRDAAAARAEDLARQLEAARSQIRALNERVDRISRSPIEADALTERLRRMVELAHAEADEITARARAAAEQSWDTARQAAERLRCHHERLVAEVDARRAQMEAEHRELMSRAHQQVEAMTRHAEQRRRDLDEQAAQLRNQVEADFQIAMRARREEARRELADQRAAAHREAQRLIDEATAHAAQIVADAQRRVDDLENRRTQLAAALRTTQQLLADAEPLLAPLPEETDPSSDEQADRTPDVSARRGSVAA
ncbi:DivIVA domain-containing protein [Amycolatopsis echigonensis]